MMLRFAVPKRNDRLSLVLSCVIVLGVVPQAIRWTDLSMGRWFLGTRALLDAR